jgi:hypothetical protein
MKRLRVRGAAARVLIFGMCLVPVIALATAERQDGYGGAMAPLAPAEFEPTTEQKTHRVGNVWLTVSNYGFFGNDEQQDVRGTADWLPKCEFPANSGVDYLFQGALWIGALVEGDTLVSVGADGWAHENEMYPCDNTEDPPAYYGSPFGPPQNRCRIDSLSIHWPIEEETAEYDSVHGVPFAVSEEDFIAVYTDTVTVSGLAPATHRPMGIEVTQRSYGWSYSYAQDFVLFDFEIKNIGVPGGEPRVLNDVWIGIYIDGDCLGPNTDLHDGAQDDVTGFREIYEDAGGNEVTINLAWIADYYGSDGATGVSGVRVVRTPAESLSVSYNWWLSDTDAQRDWGPIDTADPDDVRGTPDGDGAKYRIMSNEHFDGDQMEYAAQIPAGTPYEDTRFLLSFGPFDIPPDSTLPVTLGYICGANFVRAPGEYNFLDVGLNAVWAGKVYDVPGWDTDGDGYRGEWEYDPATGDTIWITGDGVPDFTGPPPPPAPGLQVVPGASRVELRWEGTESEEFVDPFTQEVDFAGYRVYRSSTGIVGSYTLLAEYDIIGDGFGYDLGMPSKGEDGLYYFIDEPVAPGFPKYYSVSAFDFGDPRSGVPPLESSTLIHLREIGPVFAGANPLGTEEPVRVVPNPYKITEPYREMGWEAWAPGQRWSEHTRRLDFINLKGPATIKIYTLDGDLVAEVEHTDASSPRESWDLISRNNMAVVSDIYLFSVEYTAGDHDGENEVGKFVIIK